jgi:hypothetical protein
MPQTLSPTRSLPEPVLDVLVVASEASVRVRLAAHVWDVLPSAQVRELSQLTDLVYRVAGSGVDLVVLDAEPLQPLPLTPLLAQMLKGIRPALKLICVARSEPGSTLSTDACLTDASLGDWLRTMYGAADAGLADTPPPTCLT